MKVNKISSKTWLKTALATSTVGLLTMTQSGHDGSDVVFINEKSKYFRSLIIDHSPISPSNVVRNLGIQLRADLSVADQVSKVVWSCYFNIRQLRTIRSSLTLDAAYALILSRLDYCNSHYLSTPMCELHRLRMLINTVACMVSGRFRFDHITDFVKDVLHWLLIKQSTFQSVYFGLHGLAPTYLSDFVVKSSVIPRRGYLRSSPQSQLIPAPHHRKFAECAFAVGCPMLWNLLPDTVCDVTSLTTFHRLLKDHLYNIAYENN